MIGGVATGKGPQTSAPTATEDFSVGGGGGNTPVFATLKWLASSGPSYIGADNYDAAACYPVAVALLTGLPLPGGSLAVLPFTVDGGAPVNVGDPFWVASSQDDSGTGRGKATAAIPVRLAPALNRYVKNIAPAGTIAALANVGTTLAPEYIVHMAANVAPTKPAPIADASITVKHVTFPGTTNFNAPISLTSQLDIASGESLIVKMRIPDIAQGSGLTVPLACFNAGATLGWQLTASAGSTGLTFNPRGGGADIGFPTVPGTNTICITRTGGKFRVAVNGGPVQNTDDTGGSAGAASGTFTLRDRVGSLYGLVKLNRVMLDAELLSVSGSTYSTALRVGNANLYALPLTADPNCEWFLDLSTYVSAATPHAQAGPAGTGFDFALSGVPSVLSTTLDYWNAASSLQPLLIAGPPAAVDSDGFLSTRAFSYFGGVCATQAEFADVIVGMNNLDVDDADEESACLFVNGIPIASNLADVNLGVNTYWRTVAGAGFADPGSLWSQVSSPYHWTYVIGEKMSRYTSFTSGNRLVNIAIPDSNVMDLRTSSARVAALISDGATCGGHGDDELSASAVSGAVVSRIRADIPGLLLAPNVMVRAGNGPGMRYMLDFGEGSIVPYARLIYDAVQAAATGAAVKSYWCFEGAGDWQADLPLATFVAAYAAFIDLLHALDPTAIVIVIKPAQAHFYATANGNGDTLQAFVDAITTLCGTRGFVTLLDVTGPTAITWTAAGSAIGMAPTQAAGAAALKGNIKTRIHAAQPTVY